MIPTHQHVIPVDYSLTISQAWAEICMFGYRVTFTGRESWATVSCDGTECVRVEDRENTS